MTITQVSVAGKLIPRAEFQNSVEGSSRALRLRESSSEVVFGFAEDPSVQSPAARLRYKLEGYDTRWIDRPIMMRLLLHFIDDKREIVGQKEFFLEGETTGWRGNVTTSEYTLRREQCVVPARATGIKIAFLSHGGSEGVGVIGIDSVRVELEQTGENQQRIFDLGIKGSDIALPNGNPVNWMREGSSMNIAQLGIRSLPSPHPVLVLDDEDNLNYGNWSLDLCKSITLRPGDRLTVEWQTAHSIGGSGSGMASYTSLKPGVYTFRVAGFRSNGEATGMECALPIIIVPALYRRAEFWLVLLALAVAGAALIARAVEVARARRRMAAMEREQVVQRERARIAQDLHDDIGASLTEISFMGDLAVDSSALAEEQKQHVGEMTAKVRAVVQKLDEIVWAVNPSQDTTVSLANYLCGYAQRFLKAASIACRLDRPDDLLDVPLIPHKRHNLFLAFKEALNNAARHAQASEVWIRLRVEDNRFSVVVEDNGCGLPNDTSLKETDGCGLEGMRARMEKMGGLFTITSHAGTGTSVRFEMEIPK